MGKRVISVQICNNSFPIPKQFLATKEHIFPIKTQFIFGLGSVVHRGCLIATATSREEDEGY